jgi:hypothetical protein
MTRWRALIGVAILLGLAAVIGLLLHPERSDRTLPTTVYVLLSKPDASDSSPPIVLEARATRPDGENLRSLDLSAVLSPRDREKLLLSDDRQKSELGEPIVAYYRVVGKSADSPWTEFRLERKLGDLPK